MLSRVAILGKGAGFWEVEEADEMWSATSLCNVEHNWFKGRHDKVFHMHSWEVIERIDPGVIPYCIEHNTPLFTLTTRPDVPTSVKYPFEEVSKVFNTRFFTNSACYMIAYALFIRFKRIDLFGVNHVDYGFGETKGGVQYWIGRAEGMGVEVNLGRHSGLCKLPDGKLYGYET